MSTHGAARRIAFTLVELLVVIAIIGVLVALLLPAVQGAREAARRSQCFNNQKQIGLGWLNHKSAQGFLPSGGWSPWVVGDADMGAGAQQPGGWMYQILPYIEQQSLYRMPGDGQRDLMSAGQKKQAADFIGKPVATFHCPSRRAPVAYQWNLDAAWIPKNSDKPSMVVCGDYAANGGDSKQGRGCSFLKAGQDTEDTADDVWYEWPKDSIVLTWVFPPYKAYGGAPNSVISWPSPDSKNGINFIGSEMKLQQITDGTSNTYMVGEKNLDPDKYEGTDTSPDFTNPSNTNPGSGGGDGQGYYVGFDWDTHRFSSDPPIPDTPGFDLYEQFGSAHPATWHALLCDGSVRTMSYDIELITHKRLASRNDGQAVGSF